MAEDLKYKCIKAVVAYKKNKKKTCVELSMSMLIKNDIKKDFLIKTERKDPNTL